MPAYRMKHVPSGLYYCPSREVKGSLVGTGVTKGSPVWVKTNLSKRGKVYLTRPTFKWIGTRFYDHRIPVTSLYGRNKVMSPFIPSEWVIEEVA